MSMLQTELLMSNDEISEFVYGKFFICINKFLSWLKEGEHYWFEYIYEDDSYEVRSDNNLGKRFKMEPFQLLTCFVPCFVEEDPILGFKHFYHLYKRGISKERIDDIIQSFITIKRNNKRQ